uniref:Serine protease 57 n=1 Tax=Mamestra configurata TaxID=174822 RepID=E7D009_9NEOP|nr:serine protease 57 [Mamestra configurata]
MAGLIYSPNNWLTFYHTCGGIIINNRSILTAARCGYGDLISQWRIRVGSTWAHSGGVLYNVNQRIAHPTFNLNTLAGDIAILRSAGNFVFNNNVRAALVAGPNYIVNDNQVVWAAGWGDTFAGSYYGSEQLRHVELRSINQNTCRNNYLVRGVTITANHLCSGWVAGGRDQCTYDEGGPLYHNGVVVGVRSFGIGCGQPEFPGVNTRVSSYSSWININS